MRDFTIDLIWTKLQVAITALGGWLGYFLGGLDGMMTALIVFMTLDYVTGVMCAIVDKKLSSEVGFKGICKKVLILLLVGIAHIVDMHVIGHRLRAARRCDLLLPVQRRRVHFGKRRAHRPACARKAQGGARAAPRPQR